jgi:hypothetical protein
VTESPLSVERLPPPEMIDQVKGLLPPIAVKVCCPPQVICLEVNPMKGGGQLSQEEHSAQTGELKHIIAIKNEIKANRHENSRGFFMLGSPFPIRI